MCRVQPINATVNVFHQPCSTINRENLSKRPLRESKHGNQDCEQCCELEHGLTDCFQCAESGSGSHVGVWSKNMGAES